MRSAVVLLVVFAVCWAQEAPKPCCFPKQFEGNMSVVQHQYPSELPLVRNRLSYDALGKKVAVTSFRNKGPPVKIILDYSAGKSYYIHGKYCTFQKMKDVFRPSCVPSTAMYAGPIFQGAGSDKLNEDAWTINGMGTRSVFFVTKSKCVPVEIFIFEEYVSTQRFSNITLGIKDPDVFKPPAACKVVQEKDHFFEEEFQLLDYLRMKRTA